MFSEIIEIGYYISAINVVCLLSRPYEKLKIKNSDVIKLDNIEMKIVKKKSGMSRYGIKYCIFLESVHDCGKKVKIKVSNETYYNSKIGDKVILQEIIYKYKNKLIYKIKNATDKDYEKYKSSTENKLKIHTYAEIENEIITYIKKEEKYLKIKAIISITMFCLFVILIDFLRFTRKF